MILYLKKKTTQSDISLLVFFEDKVLSWKGLMKIWGWWKCSVSWLGNTLPGLNTICKSWSRGMINNMSNFSRESSQSRDQTQVSCTEGRFFIVWTTWEVPYVCSYSTFTICLIMHWNWKRGQKKHVLSRFGRVQRFMTVWTVGCQAPLSMGFARQEEYWSRLPFPAPGHLPNLGVKPVSLVLQADSLPLSHWGSPKRSIV